MFTAHGNTLNGFPVSGHKFEGVTTLNQIEAFGLKRPAVAEKATPAEIKQDERLGKAKELRSQVNRRFDKPRMDRVGLYASYINNVEYNGVAGGTPSITLFCSGSPEYSDDSLILPYDTVLVAIDGETQTEARFMLRETLPSSGDTPISVTVYHSVPVVFAKQVLSDYNSYATPISGKVAATYGSTGALSIGVEKALAASGIDHNAVNRRSTRPVKKGVVAYDQVLTTLAGFQLNTRALAGGLNGNAMKGLNTPGGHAVPQQAVDAAAEFIRMAANDDDVKYAPSVVWQVAGVLTAQGRQPNTLNWKKAKAAYEATKRAKHGGPSTPMKDRIASIAASF